MRSVRSTLFGAPMVAFLVLVALGAMTVAGARGLMGIADDTGQGVIGAVVVSEDECGGIRTRPGDPLGPARHVPADVCGPEEEAGEETEAPPPIRREPPVLKQRAQECRAAAGHAAPEVSMATELDHTIARVLELCKRTPGSIELIDALERLAAHRVEVDEQAKSDEPARAQSVLDEMRILGP